MKKSYILSSLPLVSEGKQTTTLQNLQHLSYQVKLTGVTCTDNVSGYCAVITRDFSTANSGDYIQLVTPNAEVHTDVHDVFFNNSTSCIDKIWNSTWSVQNIKWHDTLPNPRFRFTTVSRRPTLAK